MADETEIAEIAVARHMATNTANQLMLKMLFEMLISTSDDPKGLRISLQQQLTGLADTMQLMPMDAPREAAVRGYIKEICGAVLTNNPPA